MTYIHESRSKHGSFYRMRRKGSSQVHEVKQYICVCAVKGSSPSERMCCPTIVYGAISQKYETFQRPNPKFVWFRHLVDSLYQVRHMTNK